MCIQEKKQKNKQTTTKNKNSYSFPCKENYLSRNRLFTFSSCQTLITVDTMNQTEKGEGDFFFFFFWSLMCTGKIPRDESSWSRKDHNSRNNNNASVIHKCICGAAYAFQRTFTSITSHLIIMTTPGGT